ncbi:hypothetical protein [Sphingomonas jatrophae]|uniref:Type IV secretion protein Rhs n=1 Tax=Sphingomonas jatrophae TaxID=1166337 RepID=A0A1I6JJZ0_9SPHN|nr:hypothetical protein [Sphingomonas jatrophae]SFR79263.1 hypothetical protein SAMN05192580_0373 [Sphingomonas jatrophae]
MAEIARRLTTGELRYAVEIFGSSIDYTKVLVHNTEAYFFQPSDTAITPNGEIYFPQESYKPDFSLKLTDAAWLIHELAHVWQHQRGMWVRTRGMLNRTYDYGDLATATRSFLSYGIEQQASIVGDYFRLRHGLGPTRGQGPISAYEALIPFLPGRRR